MSGRVAKRPNVVAQVATIGVEDEATQRALDALTEAVQRLQGARLRDVRVVTLVAGLNKVPHGLGRAAQGFTVVPTVASAGFAAAIDLSNPRPEVEVWINTIGVDQPNARVEVW